MSNTPIPSKIKNQLLVKSAGRCQFRGCNQSLYMDIITKRDFNKSYIAHIVVRLLQYGIPVSRRVYHHNRDAIDLV